MTRHGRAVILTVDGFSYHALATLEGGILDAVNVERRVGRGEDMIRQRACDRTWPMRQIREVRWVDEAGTF